MKKVLGLLAIMGLVVTVAGCPSPTTKATGTTPTTKAAPPATTKANGVAKVEAISLTVEPLEIKKGMSGMLKVKVKRDNFAAAEDVTIDIVEGDTKLKATDGKIGKETDSGEFAIDAKEAAVGEHKITVKGSSGKAAPAESPATVKVTE